MNPLVSVVMPVYNAEKYVSRAIESILGQTLEALELVIVNDCSTDDSEERILSFSDDRIRYMKNDRNLGIVDSLNRGIKASNGCYIARMDADDISLPERLEKQVRYLQEHPEVDVCGSWVRTMGACENIWEYPISDEEIKMSLLFGSAFAHPTIVAKRVFFERYPYGHLYDKAEDYALWATSASSSTFANFPEVLLNYRIHTQQTGKVYKQEQTDNASRIRELLLNQMGIFPNSDEMRLHDAMSYHQQVNCMDASRWLEKLIRCNGDLKRFRQEDFINFLATKWWHLCNRNCEGGFKTLKAFFTSSMRQSLHLTWYHYVKFVIKCLIKYSHAK